MSHKNIHNIPLNRVEGDLEIRVEYDDDIVSDAWSSGIMFRGIEKILIGRGALDGLVITPRICGICSITHLTAAVRALDMICGAILPDNAKRVRNLALMVEHIQSDMRHGFLMFMVDFVNPAYKDHSLFNEAIRRYEPFKGETTIEVIKETKKVLEIIAILGGQRPHTSFMVPGGIVSNPSESELLQCLYLLTRYRKWYEDRILGCSLERWQEVKSASDLDVWIDECDSHRESDLGFYIRFAREAGLNKIGKGHGNFISFGSLEMPEHTEVLGNGKTDNFIPSGFAAGTQAQTFNQEKVAEHVASSWFKNYTGGRHPFNGETNPYATGSEGKEYSWAKAPRYDEIPAETGPLAEMIIGSNPLFTDLVERDGPNAFVRELARLIRPATLMPTMDVWIRETATNWGEFYRSSGKIEHGEGFGLTQAARGALGHWVKIKNEKIEHYQIITPTAWNGSPRDSNGVRGPWEEALIGTRVRDVNNPVEVGHVIRSFDACLVCAVHMVHNGQSIGRTLIQV